MPNINASARAFRNFGEIVAGINLKIGSAQKLKHLAEHYGVNCDDVSLALGLNFLDSQEDSFVATRSCLFDGVNEYITLGDVSELQFESNQPWSGSVWFKTTSTATRILFAKREQQTSWPYTYRGYSLTFRQNDIKFDACNGTNSSALDVRTNKTPGQYSDGQWHHIAVTVDGSGDASGVQIYVDGVALAMTTVIDTLGSNTILNSQPFNWGARGGGPGSIISKFFYGNLDEGSMWNKELSQAEVTELYNSGSITNLLQHSAAANLVHWMRMGDTENYPVLIDGSTNSNNGTMVNMEEADIIIDAP